MDPKMDAGMDPLELNGELVPLVAEYFSKSLLKADDFTLEERLGIMDELLTNMVRWVAGETLAQTVFACLYLHEPGYLKDNVLRAFCFSLMKACDLIRSEILVAKIYEEEDYLFEGYSLPELNVLAEDEALLQLAEADRSLPPDQDLVRTRLLVIKDFLSLLIQMNPDSRKSHAAVVKITGDLKKTLKEIKKTLSKGLQPDSLGRMLGFDPFINRKLSVHSPPKPSEYLSRERVRNLSTFANTDTV